MTKKLPLLAAIVGMAGLGVVAYTQTARTQASGGTITVGIYTPTVEFANSAARLQYVQRLGKAIEAATGSKVMPKSFTSLGSLKSAKMDFAIIDAQCVATNKGWNVLANGQVEGKSSQSWALYSRVGPSMAALKGKKVAYVKTGCRDDDFMFNAMLGTEVDSKYFGGKVGKPALGGAVAEVASFKGAEAVFAPSGSQKGLTKVFDATSVPGPAFVQMNRKLSGAVVAKVKTAVTSYGGGGAISGWTAGSSSPYSSLRGKMAKHTKDPVFAPPVPVRVDAKDILVEPKTLDEAALTEVGQHFAQPPQRQ